MGRARSIQLSSQFNIPHGSQCPHPQYKLENSISSITGISCSLWNILNLTNSGNPLFSPPWMCVSLCDLICSFFFLSFTGPSFKAVVTLTTLLCDLSQTFPIPSIILQLKARVECFIVICPREQWHSYLQQYTEYNRICKHSAPQTQCRGQVWWKEGLTDVWYMIRKHYSSKTWKLQRKINTKLEWT